MAVRERCILAVEALRFVQPEQRAGLGRMLWCAQTRGACGDLRTQATSAPSTTPPISVAPLGNQHQPAQQSHAQLRTHHPQLWMASPPPTVPSTPPSTLAGCQQNQQRAFSSSTSPKISVLESNVPTWLLPYVHLSRLHKPIGSWLLAWPCFWSIGMASTPGYLPDLYLLGLFGTGAVLLRGAGCTINDMWDKDLDAKVARTQYRPLASGRLGMGQATVWLGGQLTLGLLILLQLNDVTKLLGVASLPLVAAYPLMKRITFMPQLFLGLTINWGAIMGWAAATGTVSLPATMPLYLSAVCWTLIYDTVYAHMDRRDDETAGIKSTARLFGEHTKPVLAGVAIDAGPMFYMGMLAGSGHVLWQVQSVSLDNSADCLSKFKSNTLMGALPMSGIVLDRLLAAA